MSRHALVIPAVDSEPIRTITWDEDDELLDLLYDAIACDTVEIAARNVEIDGAPSFDVWCDEDGLLVDVPVVNRRINHFAEALGQPLAPLVGTVVLTGCADEDGVTLGLDAELLAELEGAVGA